MRIDVTRIAADRAKCIRVKLLKLCQQHPSEWTRFLVMLI